MSSGVRRFSPHALASLVAVVVLLTVPRAAESSRVSTQSGLDVIGSAFGISTSGYMINIPPTPRAALSPQGGGPGGDLERERQNFASGPVEVGYLYTIGQGTRNGAVYMDTSVSEGIKLGDLVSADHVFSSASATCAGPRGAAQMDSSFHTESIGGLHVLGKQVSVTGDANQTITRDVPDGTLTVVINRQIRAGNTITVHGLDVTLSTDRGTQHFIVGSATAGISCSTDMRHKTFRLTIYGVAPGALGIQAAAVYPDGRNEQASNPTAFCPATWGDNPPTQCGQAVSWDAVVGIDPEHGRLAACSAAEPYMGDPCGTASLMRLPVGTKLTFAFTRSNSSHSESVVFYRGAETITDDMTNSVWYDFTTGTGGTGKGASDNREDDEQDEPEVQPTEVTEAVPEPTMPPIPDDEGNTGAGGMAAAGGAIAGGVSILLLSGYALLRRRWLTWRSSNSHRPGQWTGNRVSADRSTACPRRPILGSPGLLRRRSATPDIPMLQHRLGSPPCEQRPPRGEQQLAHNPPRPRRLDSGTTAGSPIHPA